MNLLNNPIANMPGHVFIFVYIIFVGLTFLLCRWQVRQADPTLHIKPLKIPEEPDPYEIAYLRGGAEEVGKMVILNLLQREYLKENESHLIVQHPEHPDLRHLSELERSIFDWDFQLPGVAISQLLIDSILPFCMPYEERLHQQQLLYPSVGRDKVIRAFFCGACCILTLGGYKFLVAGMKGYSRGFLLIAIIIGLLIFYQGYKHIMKKIKRSHAGENFLTRMQETFAGLKDRSLSGPEPAMGHTSLLLLGLFGSSVLAGTAYGGYMPFFDQAGVGDGGFIGGESLGGSCGSSCGGCGGGGCGGCGG